MNPPIKIAYILDLFPVLSETFIVREILKLKKNLFDVSIYARLNTSSENIYSEVIHNDSKDLLNDVQYFASLMSGTKALRWFQIILSHLHFLLISPVKYLKTLYYASSNGNNFLKSFVFAAHYARIMQEAGITHMHVHFALKACTYAMFISRISGIPYSFTVHAHDIFTQCLAELIQDKFNYAKFAVCISEFNKQYVLSHYKLSDQNKLKVIHCGLNLLSFTPEEKLSNKKHTILSIGRLVDHKGFKYLIEACNLLNQNTELDFTCTIIGEGPDRPNLVNLISSYKLNDVIHLAGAKEQSEVIKALNNADLFVLPCITDDSGIQDGIPVVLMEAMAMKIPVISTRVSGIPELVQHGSGILVEQKDPKGLSEAITHMSHLSDTDRETMINKGRSAVEESFNIDKEGRKLAELINN